MKPTTTVPLLLLLTLSGPALADSSSASTMEACPLTGPLMGATEECRALRQVFREEITDCMDQKHAEADARAGQVTKVNAHTSRARFLTCEAETLSKPGIASR